MSDNPAGWRVRTLNDLVPRNRPICYGVLKPGNFEPDGVPLVRIVDLIGGQVSEGGLFRISASLDREFHRSRLVGGEVLLSIQGTIGRVAVAPKSLAGANISRTIARVALDPVVGDPVFLAHWMTSPSGQRALGEAVLGTTRDSLNIAILRRVKLRLPPLPEQRRIAGILDSVDESIHSTERLMEKQTSTSHALQHALLTKEFDVNQLSSHLASSPGALVQTGPFGSQLHAHEYVAHGIPVIMPQDIVAGKIDDSGVARITETRASTLRRHRLRAGDIVLARRGDLTKCAVVSREQEGWLCGTGCLLLRPGRAVNSDWLAAMYRHDTCQRQINAVAIGSTMVNLNTGILLSLEIPWPPKKEQDRIAEIIRTSEKAIEGTGAHLAKLRKLKHGLMEDLLTGRVRVKVERV